MRILFLLLTVCITLVYAQKLEITADKFKANDSDKEVHFVGNAKIKQELTRVQASEVIIYFGDNNSTEKYKAIGGVKFDIETSKASYHGKCSTMEYFPKKKIYKLSGTVQIVDKQNGRYISANSVEVNSKTGAFTVKGSRKSPAKLTFDMQ